MTNNYLDFLERQVSIFELALEESILRFDVSDNPEFKKQLKRILLDVAIKKYEQKNDDTVQYKIHL